MFDSAEEALNKVARFVDVVVERARLGPVATRGMTACAPLAVMVSIKASES
jgi:hypothetical protein